MANKPLVIIHGWSDNARSFIKMGEQLATATKRKYTLINLADYISLDDDFIMDDLIDAMQTAWLNKKLPTEAFSVDAVIHSTGGLIIRAWLARYYTGTTAPIKNLVMLAPANFGSPLAQKGRSLIGRIIKGWRGQKLFQTGTNILKALEIASPYTWDLAFKDRFGTQNFYGAGKILCTVLVGNHGLTGIAAAANEPGTDGVVRISTANMNSAYCEIDFLTDPQNPTFKITPSKGNLAFGVIDGENHPSITGNDGGYRNKDTLPTIINALNVDDKNFNQWIKTLAQNNVRVMANGKTSLNSQGYQNTVCYCHDQHGNQVKDFFLEFYAEEKKNKWLAERFHTEVIQSVHAYVDNYSYRSLLINCTILNTLFNACCPRLNISLTAMPELLQNGLVGYRTFGKNAVGALMLDHQQVPLLFQENRTLLVDINIRREQTNKVFQLKTL